MAFNTVEAFIGAARELGRVFLVFLDVNTIGEERRSHTIFGWSVDTSLVAVGVPVAMA